MRADESGAQNAGQPAGGSKIDAAAPFLLSLILRLLHAASISVVPP